MTIVTKARFKEMFFKHGREKDGWGASYWARFFEQEPERPMKYLIEEPLSAEHVRMMIVSDYAVMEYRLFFMTEETEESFFRFPGD